MQTTKKHRKNNYDVNWKQNKQVDQAKKTICKVKVMKKKKKKKKVQ